MATSRPIHRSRAGRGGFTLIELVVTISIIAVLTAIAIPALSGSRFNSKAARSLSNQRQLLAGVVLYTLEYRDAFPYMGTPGNPTGPILVKGYNVSFQGYFTDQSLHWANLIVPDYCDIPTASIEMREVGDRRGIIHSVYFLTETAFAEPKLFTDWAGTFPPNSYFRATRTSEVVFASEKGLMLDISLGEPTQQTTATGGGGYLVGFADGSASRKPGSEADPSEVVNQPYSNGAMPVLNTRDGLAGRDF